MITIDSKTCPKCKGALPLSSFRKNKWMRDGLSTYCRECFRVLDRESYARNKQVRQERALAYYAEHREERKAAMRKRFHDLSPEQRDITRQHMRNIQNKRRARIAMVYVEDVEAIVVLEMDDGICGICGEDVDPFKFHVDHIIPIDRGGEHSYANSQVAHPFCNFSKNNRLPFEMEQAAV